MTKSLPKILPCELYSIGREVVDTRKAPCGKCGRPTTHRRVRYRPVAQLMFVPLLPLPRRQDWFCAECGHSIGECSLSSLNVVAAACGFFLMLSVWFGATLVADRFHIGKMDWASLGWWSGLCFLTIVLGVITWLMSLAEYNLPAETSRNR